MGFVCAVVVVERAWWVAGAYYPAHIPERVCIAVFECLGCI